MKRGRHKHAKRQSRRDKDAIYERFWELFWAEAHREMRENPPTVLIGTFKGVPVYGYETLG